MTKLTTTIYIGNTIVNALNSEQHKKAEDKASTAMSQYYSTHTDVYMELKEISKK